MQPVARTRCPSSTANSHTYGLRSIFSDAHVAGENDLALFRASERETLRGFFDTLKYPPALPGDISVLLILRYLARLCRRLLRDSIHDRGDHGHSASGNGNLTGESHDAKPQQERSKGEE